MEGNRLDRNLTLTPGQLTCFARYARKMKFERADQSCHGPDDP